MLMQAHGISTSSTSESSKLISEVLKTSPTPATLSEYLKPEPSSNPASVSDDVIMDDQSPISNDPMMSQSSPLVATKSHTNSVSMEEISDMLS